MSKYINYKLILLLIALPIVLVIVFPSPYFESWYDYEPDYFANILSIFLNNHPVDYTHPGLTVTYLSNKLMNSWVNKCNYKVDYSVGYFADIKSIFLKVKT